MVLLWAHLVSALGTGLARVLNSLVPRRFFCKENIILNSVLYIKISRLYSQSPNLCEITCKIQSDTLNFTCNFA